MRVLFAASEAHPLVKTGGLGDVAGALPAALRQLGIDARLLLPGYPAVLDALALDVVYRDVSLLPGIEPASLLAGQMPDGDTPVFVVHCPSLYVRDGGPYQAPNGSDWPDNAQRFGLLARVAAAMSSSPTALSWRPDLLHLNDWQSALAAAYLALTGQRAVPVVQSIHNLAYLGAFGAEMIDALALPRHGFQMHGYELHGHISLLKAGIYYSDAVTTVSPRYAQEIRTEAFGSGLHGLMASLGPRLTGILNGIDEHIWNPASDPHLAANYNAAALDGKARCKSALQEELGLPAEPGTPLLATISRLTPQKGIDLIAPALHQLASRPFQLVALGSGDRKIEAELRDLATAAPTRIRFCNTFDEGLAHRIEAGADMFLMPSRFEPCGLNQMYSMRYGTPPIVHNTGGLADTVVHADRQSLESGRASGFVFDVADVTGLRWAIGQALDMFAERTAWQALQRSGMSRDFSWRASAKSYHALYTDLVDSRRITS